MSSAEYAETPHYDATDLPETCHACGLGIEAWPPYIGAYCECVSVERHHSGIECYGTDRDGYYVSRLYIGYTEAEAVADFRDYLREQETRGTWRSGGA